MSKKILIVEDEHILRSLLAGKLREEDFEVIEAIDAKEGLEKLKEEKIDLVLLDLVLPGIDGYEFLKRVKRDQELEDIPIMVLSNLGQQEEIKKALDLGARDYLIKSNFSLEEITEKVKNILGVS